MPPISRRRIATPAAASSVLHPGSLPEDPRQFAPDERRKLVILSETKNLVLRPRKRALELRSAGDFGMQEALQVRLADRRLAGRHIVELAGKHPLFQIADEVEEVVERVHDKEQRLVVIDLERLVDRPLQPNRIPLHLV